MSEIGSAEVRVIADEPIGHLEYLKRQQPDEKFTIAVTVGHLYRHYAAEAAPFLKSPGGVLKDRLELEMLYLSLEGRRGTGVFLDAAKKALIDPESRFSGVYNLGTLDLLNAMYAVFEPIWLPLLPRLENAQVGLTLLKHVNDDLLIEVSTRHVRKHAP